MSAVEKEAGAASAASVALDTTKKIKTSFQKKKPRFMRETIVQADDNSAWSTYETPVRPPFPTELKLSVSDPLRS